MYIKKHLGFAIALCLVSAGAIAAQPPSTDGGQPHLRPGSSSDKHSVAAAAEQTAPSGQASNNTPAKPPVLDISQSTSLAEKASMLRQETLIEDLELKLDKVRSKRHDLTQKGKIADLKKAQAKKIKEIQEKADQKVSDAKAYFHKELKKLKAQLADLKAKAGQQDGPGPIYLTKVTMYQDHYVGTFLSGDDHITASAGGDLHDGRRLKAIDGSHAVVEYPGGKDKTLFPVSTQEAKSKIAEAHSYTKSVECSKFIVRPYQPKMQGGGQYNPNQPYMASVPPGMSGYANPVAPAQGNQAPNANP